jgi:uncharacterized RDD family membrane protein YckC
VKTFCASPRQFRAARRSGTRFERRAPVWLGSSRFEVGVSLALGLFGVHFTTTPVRAAFGTGGWIMVSGAYFISFWTLAGEMPGMRFMGIKVIVVGGGKPTLQQSLRRSIGMLLCALPAGAGFLLVLVDEQRRGPHDRIASTLVVHQLRRLPPTALTELEAVPASAQEAPRTSHAPVISSAGLKEIDTCASS